MEKTLTKKEKNDFILDKETIICLLKSEEDIKEGRTISAEEVFKELYEEYGF